MFFMPPMSLGLTRYSRAGGSGIPFDPSIFFANGEQGAWYDPSDLTTLFQDAAGTVPVTADGDPVGLMLDKSGRGHHATQNDISLAPIRSPIGLGSGLRNGRNYSGLIANTHLIADSLAEDVYRGPAYTEHVAFQDISSAAIVALFGAGNNAVDNRFSWFGRSSSAVVKTYNPGGSVIVTGPTWTVGNIRVMSARYGPDSISIWENGIKVADREPGGVAISALNQFTIGGLRRTSLGNIFNGKIAEILICQGYQSDGTIQTVHNYLTHKHTLPSNAVFDVVVLGGQSNMIARAVGSPVHPNNVYQWTGSSIELPTNPLAHVGPVAGQFGPDVSFAEAYVAANPGRKLVFVPCADGGTSFSTGYWRQGGNGYNRMRDRVNALVAAYPNANIRAVLMQIGENDALAANGSFEADVDAFISNMRTDASATSGAKFLWGGMVQSYVNSQPGYRAFQDVLANVGSRNSNCAYVDSESPTVLLDKGDGVHFDADGITEMGRRYFDSL
ncbi:sialate O-acetylesterase [Aquamicrobium defluvii]|uniref:Sialate O-acetylesterase domain-containing protein n=1 Tax=Aquamicrobium defluvii TaxID=69279 RepID=A0A4R6YEB0_9HYPH|nr:sialate O-acetylesterase [Aquamicrobium defluvii]TDR34341.1 hypothetical protein DES43_115111 [Aquamicrobium defluvii]